MILLGYTESMLKQLTAYKIDKKLKSRIKYKKKDTITTYIRIQRICI